MTLAIDPSLQDYQGSVHHNPQHNPLITATAEGDTMTISSSLGLGDIGTIVNQQVAALLQMQDINEVKRDIFQSQGTVLQAVDKVNADAQLSALNTQIGSLNSTAAAKDNINGLATANTNALAQGQVQLTNALGATVDRATNGLAAGIDRATNVLATGIDRSTNELAAAISASSNTANNHAADLANGQIQTREKLAQVGSDLNTNLLVGHAGITNHVLSQAAQLNTNMLTGHAALGREIDHSQYAVTGAVKDGNAATLANLNQLNTHLLLGNSAQAAHITAEAEKTRGLINSIDRENLNRLIVVADNKIAELLGDRSAVAAGVTVTQTVNQAQAQAQQQQLAANNNSLLSVLVAEIQRANSSLVNLGTITGNASTAATNVK